MSESLLSLKDVAGLLGVSEFSVKRIAKENLLTSVQEGGEFKFRKEDVDKYIEINQMVR